MRCCDVEALWEEMREGVEPRHEHVLAHLRGCTTCQGLYEQFEGIAYCLSCLPIVEAPANLVPRILDHIRTMSRPASEDADSFCRIPSPLGTLYVAFRESGITFVGIDRGESTEILRAKIEHRLHRSIRIAQALPWVVETIERFFRTWSVDPTRVDISRLTEFEQAALRQAAQIPHGEVRSYSWVAREIGRPQASRAVGQAMARNPVALLFPCHRVVDSHGALHNYAYGVTLKAVILQMEGYVKLKA